MGQGAALMGQGAALMGHALMMRRSNGEGGQYE
jgi:hypothetical protein